MKMGSGDISERIARIVQRLTDPDGAQDAVSADFKLGAGGLMDSVWALQLVVALETEFAISVEDSDVKPENFQDLCAITQFVMRKIEGVQGKT